MSVWPNGLRTKPDISTPYGGYKGHNGTDFINFDYNCATDAGRVVFAGWNPSGAGYEVRVQHADYISRYLHNLSNLLVGFDDLVSVGQPLGLQGATGDATGKHLHYEVWPGGNINNRVDPVPYLSARISSTAGGGTTPYPDVDPAELARLERIRRAKGMSYLCIPTTDWKDRPLMSDGKPMSIVWNGPSSTLIDTPDKWYSATRLHLTDEDRKIVDARDWAWLMSLLPTTGGTSGTPGAPTDLTPVLEAIAKLPDAEETAAEVIRQQKLPGN